MHSHLSFVPTYHDPVQRPEGLVWRPVYNPGRECVRREKEQIQAEGGQVDDKLWEPVRGIARVLRHHRAKRVEPMKAPVVSKVAELCQVSTATDAFIFLNVAVYFLFMSAGCGELLLLALCPDWNPESILRVIAAISLGTVSLVTVSVIAAKGWNLACNLKRYSKEDGHA